MSLLSRGVGKDLGEKVGMRATSDGERGGGHVVVIFVDQLDLAVKHPHSLGHASVVGRCAPKSTKIVNG